MALIVFSTCANEKEAGLISAALIKKRLAACVNIIKGIESVFWWKGKIEKSKEVLLIIKTNKSKLTKATKIIKTMHSYEVPEVIAINIIGGYKPYLGWIDESVR